MAIGRAEDRDTPWDPVMFNIARMFRSPVRVTHLGQRSDRPHTQAGHMTAIDQTCFSRIKSLHARGPSTHGSRPAPGPKWGILSPPAPARTYDGAKECISGREPWRSGSALGRGASGAATNGRRRR